MRDDFVEGSHGPIPIRVYVPRDSPAAKVLYLHGGGFVVGDLDTCDAHCRAVAARAGVIIASVDYALAPEHPYPRALQDVVDVLKWLPDGLTGTTGLPIVTAGDSAGGLLASWAPQQVPAAVARQVSGQLLLYPMLDSTMSFPSARTDDAQYTLDRGTVRWFWSCFGTDGTCGVGTLGAALGAGHVAAVHAPAGARFVIVVTAGCDPLKDEAISYGTRLAKSGARTIQLHYPTLGHGFFGWGAFVPAANAAIDEICGALRGALCGGVAPAP